MEQTIVIPYAQRTRSDFLSTTKNRSENRFVCADFCSDIKSLRSFLRVACDKKSVVCADSVREKIGPSLRLFLGAPYNNKSNTECSSIRPTYIFSA